MNLIQREMYVGVYSTVIATITFLQFFSITGPVKYLDYAYVTSWLVYVCIFYFYFKSHGPEQRNFAIGCNFILLLSYSVGIFILSFYYNNINQLFLIMNLVNIFICLYAFWTMVRVKKKQIVMKPMFKL